MSEQTRPLVSAPTIPPLEELMQHIPELVQTRHVRANVQGGGTLGRWNAAIAVRITKVVGTMYCAYAFALIAFVALPQALGYGIFSTQFVNWLSSNFLQLILLPIIIVGQNVISAAQDKRAEADHKTLTALHEMSKQQLEILDGQNKILDLLQKSVVKG